MSTRPRWIQALRRLFTHPGTELTRWQRASRFVLELGRFGARQLREDRAPQMAAALSYRTLFGLLPVLVVATVLIRAVLGGDEFIGLVKSVLEAAGLYDIGIATEVTDLENVSVSSVGELLEPMVTQASGLRFAAIGWVGLLVLIYAAIGLMVTIENSFNTVTRAPEGRSWTKRVPMYWFVLTVGPVAIALTFFIDTQVTKWILAIDGWHTLLSLAALVWTFSLVWLFMFAVYMLVPNRTVGVRSALLGAFVATVLLSIGKETLGAYMQNAVSFRHIYGSLGLIPLFMFWVYVMWLVVLFGLEVATTLHRLRGRRLAEIDSKRQPVPDLVDPAAVIPIMELVAGRFRDSRPTSTAAVVEALGLPEEAVRQILGRLVEDRFLHRIEGPERAVTLALPPEQITADRLIDVGYSLTTQGRPASGLLGRLRDAQRALAAETTLASLLSARGGPGQAVPG